MNKQKTVPSIPRTWDELVALKDYLTDCSADFLRLPEDRQFYQLYRELVPRHIALQIIRRQIGEHNVALIKNNFPYTKVLEFLPYIKHYCLWSLIGKLDTSQIKKCVKERFSNRKWFYSIRKAQHKSIPEIWHCHVFINTSSDE